MIKLKSVETLLSVLIIRESFIASDVILIMCNFELYTLTSLMNDWKFENIPEASFFSAFLICEIKKVEKFQSYEPLWAGDPLPKWPPRLGPAAGGRKPTGWAEWANAFGLGFTGNRAEILYYSRNKPCMCHSASMTCEQYTSFSRRGLHWKSLFKRNFHFHSIF